MANEKNINKKSNTATFNASLRTSLLLSSILLVSGFPNVDIEGFPLMSGVKMNASSVETLIFIGACWAIFSTILEWLDSVYIEWKERISEVKPIRDQIESTLSEANNYLASLELTKKHLVEMQNINKKYEEGKYFELVHRSNFIKCIKKEINFSIIEKEYLKNRNYLKNTNDLDNLNKLALKPSSLHYAEAQLFDAWRDSRDDFLNEIERIPEYYGKNISKEIKEELEIVVEQAFSEAQKNWANGEHDKQKRAEFNKYGYEISLEIYKDSYKEFCRQVENATLHMIEDYSKDHNSFILGIGPNLEKFESEIPKIKNFKQQISVLGSSFKYSRFLDFTRLMGMKLLTPFLLFIVAASHYIGEYWGSISWLKSLPYWISPY